VKIDLVIGSLQVGGAEKQLCALAELLYESGTDVCVVTLFDSGTLANRLVEAGVPVISLSLSHRNVIRGTRLYRGAVGWWRLAVHWRKRRPSAIQAWLPEAQIIALPIARMLGVPCRIMAIRSMADAVNLSRSAWIGLRIAASSATAVMANSAASLCDPAWNLGKAARFLVRNGVDVPQELGSAMTQPARAVVIANLTPIKGHDVLLEAVASLAQPPMVDLVGSGRLEAQITAQINTLRLDDRVNMLGGVEDVTPILLNSQFAILPSPSEGLPNALLEAMSAGLPVVAFRVGGIPEIVEDGVTGILVEPGDVPGLAAAIERVANDPEWRAKAGAIARERMAEFSWQSVAKRNLEIMTASTNVKRK
jgi:glycosyltransferase involved in cell wall biosynthesis